jgi:hypothetical protein
MKTNLKEWKTTALGVVLLIAAAADLWHFERLNDMALGALVVIGILFLFAPDKALSFLIKKTEK